MQWCKVSICVSYSTLQSLYESVMFVIQRIKKNSKTCNLSNCEYLIEKEKLFVRGLYIWVRNEETEKLRIVAIVESWYCGVHFVCIIRRVKWFIFSFYCWSISSNRFTFCIFFFISFLFWFFSGQFYSSERFTYIYNPFV